MCRRLLGQPVDIHGGGTDLIFPHHESELAQAEAVPGERPFVRHWMHTGTVYLGGQKMSKSLGNLAFVGELLDRYGPVAVRSHLLRRHYREDWEFDERALAQPVPRTEGPSDRAAFFAALDRDLNTPSALAILERATESTARSDADWIDEGRALLGLDL